MLQASFIDDSCGEYCRKHNESRGTDPRQRHAHFGHPVAIVLAVSDGMHDLEVAFQGDDHEPKLSGYGTK